MKSDLEEHPLTNLLSTPVLSRPAAAPRFIRGRGASRQAFQYEGERREEEPMQAPWRAQRADPRAARGRGAC